MKGTLRFAGADDIGREAAVDGRERMAPVRLLVSMLGATNLKLFGITHWRRGADWSVERIRS
jgi:hypothetical protein